MKLYSDKEIDKRIEEYQRRAELFAGEDNPVTGLRTGIEELDWTTMGVQKDHLWVVMGRTGVGKTYLVCYMAHSMRLQKKRVLFVNREMDPHQVHGRIDALTAKFAFSSWRKGKLDAEEMGRYMRLKKILKTWEGTIEIVPPIDKVTPKGLRAFVNKHGLKHGQYDVVVVDYINRMTVDDYTDNVREIRAIADGLKDIAYKDHIPVIAVAQTNRAGVSMKKGGQGAGTENIYGGDAIGWNADVVLSLHRTARMKVNNQMGLDMVKHRHGDELSMILSWRINEGVIKVEALNDKAVVESEAESEELSDE